MAANDFTPENLIPYNPNGSQSNSNSSNDFTPENLIPVNSNDTNFQQHVDSNGVQRMTPNVNGIQYGQHPIVNGEYHSTPVINGTQYIPNQTNQTPVSNIVNKNLPPMPMFGAQLQGSITNDPVQQMIKAQVDPYLSFFSGLASLPREGMNALDNGFNQLVKTFAPQYYNAATKANISIPEYKPQTQVGQVANTLGQALPYFTAPGEALAKVGMNSLEDPIANLATRALGQLGVGGGLSALSQYANTGHINPMDTAVQGGLNAAIPIGGETIQKGLAKIIGGINPEHWESAIDSIRNNASIFAKQLEDFNFDKKFKEIAQPIKNLINTKTTDPMTLNPHLEMVNDEYGNIGNAIQQSMHEYENALGQKVRDEANKLSADQNNGYSRNEIDNLINVIKRNRPSGEFFNRGALNKLTQFLDENTTGDFPEGIDNLKEAKIYNAKAAKNTGSKPQEDTYYHPDLGFSKTASELEEEGFSPSSANFAETGFQKINPEAGNVNQPIDLTNANLKISPSALNEARKLSDYQINWDVSKSSQNIKQQIRDAFANIIKDEHPDFKQANEDYSNFAKFKDDNPFITSDNLGNTLRTISSPASQTAQYLNKLNGITDYLPNGQELLNRLKVNQISEQNVLKQQQDAIDYRKLLGKGIANDLSKYDKADIETQNAFDELNQLDPNNTLGQYKALRQIQGGQKPNTNGLSGSAIDELNKIMQNQTEYNAKQAFEGKLSSWHTLSLIHQGGRLGSALTPGAATGIVSHNPLAGGAVTSLGILNMSPAFQKLMVNMYGNQIPSKAIMAGFQTLGNQDKGNQK